MSSSHGGEGGRYARYKLATKSFVSWLGTAASTTIATTAGIVEAVGVIVLQRTPPLASVLADLRTSIKLRREMHAMHTRQSDIDADEDNASHALYISVLEDSYKRLRAIAVDTTSDAVHTEGSSLNAFDSLSLDEPEMPPPEVGVDVRIPKDLTHTEVTTQASQINRGLASKPHLNGQLAYAAQNNEDTGRYTVR